MTYRYRCCMCGSSSSTSAKAARDHLYKRHRDRLIRGLGIIETFGTQDALTTSSTPLRTRQDTDMGVTGEGDS